VTLKELILAKKAALIKADEDNAKESIRCIKAHESVSKCFLNQLKINERLNMLDELLEGANNGED
jgi:hypothetical protein